MSLFSGALIALSERTCNACLADASIHFLCNSCFPVNARIVAYDAIDPEVSEVSMTEVSEVSRAEVSLLRAEVSLLRAEVSSCLDCSRSLNPNDPPSSAQRPSTCMDCRRKCKRCRNGLMSSEMTNRRLGNHAGVHCRKCREELSYRFWNM
jgi:hypothetical protein